MIRGVVLHQGPAQPPRPIDTSGDPKLAERFKTSPFLSDEILVRKDGVQNAIVYISKGAERFTYTAPQTPVVLEQRDGRFAPRAVIVRVGQPLVVENTDTLFYNLHGLSKQRINSEFNASQPAGARNTRTFARAEVGFRLQCDIHKWMAAHVAVLTHPFGAVTDADGHFELKHVPDGTYTISVWHDALRLPTEPLEITVKEGGVSEVQLTLRPAVAP